MGRVNSSTVPKDSAPIRRQRALQLRIAGNSYRKIAEALGVSHTQIEHDVAHELAELAKVRAALAEQLRDLESERLDVARAAIAGQVSAGHLGAIGRWKELSESYRKLWGLDAPVKQDVTSNGETIKLYQGVDPDGV